MKNAPDRLEDSDVSRGEILELCLFSLFVGVDTRRCDSQCIVSFLSSLFNFLLHPSSRFLLLFFIYSGVTSWNLVYLALNPDIQNKLYKELSEAVRDTGGQLTSKTSEEKMTPLLHNVMR